MPDSESLEPIETLYESGEGIDLPLPEAIARVYGRLHIPEHGSRPYVISNFVASLDGVVTLGIPGHSGGGDISGHNRQDLFLMGLLRAISDVVIISSGILRVAPDQVWTPGAVYPAMREAYQALRSAMGKTSLPATVIITAQGAINVDLPVFKSKDFRVAILTTAQGVKNIAQKSLPTGVEVVAVKQEGLFTSSEIIETIQTIVPAGIYLMEAGPHMHATFIDGGGLDELFLTLSPLIAGRIGADIRPGFVADHLFAPDKPVWCKLYSLKRCENHLFLRYQLPVATEKGE